MWWSVLKSLQWSYKIVQINPYSECFFYIQHFMNFISNSVQFLSFILPRKTLWHAFFLFFMAPGHSLIISSSSLLSLPPSLPPSLPLSALPLSLPPPPTTHTHTHTHIQHISQAKESSNTFSSTIDNIKQMFELRQKIKDDYAARVHKPRKRRGDPSELTAHYN